MPSWVVWMVTGESLGREWPETKRGLGPCFVSISPVLEAVLVDAEIGAFGLVLAPYM